MSNVGRLVLRLAFVVFVVSLLSFWLLDAAPGDPATARVGVNATPEVVAKARAELGLDDPFLVRYARWAGDALHGDLGESYRTPGTTTWSLLATALPNTVLLLVYAQILALAIAVPLAVTAARRPGSRWDRTTSAVAFGFFALPAFVLGVYLSYFLAVRWGLLPAVATDLPGVFEDPVENVRQLALPSLTLGLTLVAVYLRLLRSDLISTLQQDYILLARARGLSDRRILWRHALRPSSMTLLTAVGLNTGALIGGAVIIEVLFAINGMGRLTVNAVFASDYPVVQGAVLLFSLAFVLANFVVDVLYVAIDPRVRR
ncbi:MAG: ABC transporter permease [Chloroflexota bacterium]|nr:ABC transporter permease [Chloroflexota bacterium]